MMPGGAVIKFLSIIIQYTVLLTEWIISKIKFHFSLALPLSVMTYHQLRRCNIIMSYMKQHRVVQGYVDLTKVSRSTDSVIFKLSPYRSWLRMLSINLVQCLRDAEKKKVASIDKKTVSK